MSTTEIHFKKKRNWGGSRSLQACSGNVERFRHAYILLAAAAATRHMRQIKTLRTHVIVSTLQSLSSVDAHLASAPPLIRIACPLLHTSRPPYHRPLPLCLCVISSTSR